MAIKIEVISEDTLQTKVAYYFRINPTDMVPGADRETRTPAGSALSGQELSDLKRGSIVEIIVDYPFVAMKGLTVAGKQALFEAAWEATSLTATEQYQNRYALAGRYFDNTWGG